MRFYPSASLLLARGLPQRAATSYRWVIPGRPQLGGIGGASREQEQRKKQSICSIVFLGVGWGPRRCTLAAGLPPHGDACQAGSSARGVPRSRRTDSPARGRRAPGLRSACGDRAAARTCAQAFSSWAKSTMNPVLRSGSPLRSLRREGMPCTPWLRWPDGKCSKRCAAGRTEAVGGSTLRDSDQLVRLQAEPPAGPALQYATRAACCGPIGPSIGCSRSWQTPDSRSARSAPGWETPA